MAGLPSPLVESLPVTFRLLCLLVLTIAFPALAEVTLRCQDAPLPSDGSR